MSEFPDGFPDETAFRRWLEPRLAVAAHYKRETGGGFIDDRAAAVLFGDDVKRMDRNPDIARRRQYGGRRVGGGARHDGPRRKAVAS